MRVIILADESANWRVAGLRQIERIIFALEEFASRHTATQVIASIRWAGTLDQRERHIPQRRVRSAIEFVEALDSENAITIPTRLVITRNAIDQLALGSVPTGRLLSATREIPAAEKWLANSLGKSQDGWVARHLDRRISTAITRRLLHLPIQPMHATIGAFVFALAGCALLVRGDYVSVLLGAVLFYGFSILDGCDGEIARAKYLDSRAGARLDFVIDTIANVLFVISLGAGLNAMWREQHLLLEGIVTGALIVASEVMMTVGASNPEQHQTEARHSGIYARHTQMLGHSGALAFAEGAVRLIVQLTKRDVAWLAFVLLAALNEPQWILHLSCAVAAVTCTLAALAIIRRPRARRT